MSLIYKRFYVLQEFFFQLRSILLRHMRPDQRAITLADSIGVTAVLILASYLSVAVHTALVLVPDSTSS